LGYLNPPPAPTPVIVYKDVGGLVSDYEAQTEIYRRENREVRLHECRSACTMALSLPNVCVYPHSLLKFHQAYNALNREVDLGVSATLFASYPTAVQERLGNLTRKYRVLTGAELIELGLRNCNGDDRTIVASRKPPVAPRAASNPLSEIAQSVRTTIASVWRRPDEAEKVPIRVAVRDRSPVPQTMARLGARESERRQSFDVPASAEPRWSPRMLGDAKIEIDYGETPMPPRRPPSVAFTSQEPLPPLAYTQLIHGAQPVVANTQFVARATFVR
jgi:hypothetical protein